MAGNSTNDNRDSKGTDKPAADTSSQARKKKKTKRLVGRYGHLRQKHIDEQKKKAS